MSESNTGLDVNGSEREEGKREVKLTAKALANKIATLQKECKTNVNQIKRLIPAIKDLMRKKENAPQVQSQLEN